ncbi:hypothetical protein [Sphingomonas faeni]|uniref:hypothetical protein n=1 Tax=Sphingomonas faeni TaxID=185950 RepID=UPI003364F966
METWRTDYSTGRPHDSLGGVALAEFIKCPRQRDKGQNVQFPAVLNEAQVMRDNDSEVLYAMCCWHTTACIGWDGI